MWRACEREASAGKNAHLFADEGHGCAFVQKPQLACRGSCARHDMSHEGERQTKKTDACTFKEGGHTMMLGEGRPSYHATDKNGHAKRRGIHRTRSTEEEEEKLV